MVDSLLSVPLVHELAGTHGKVHAVKRPDQPLVICLLQPAYLDGGERSGDDLTDGSTP